MAHKPYLFVILAALTLASPLGAQQTLDCDGCIDGNDLAASAVDWWKLSASVRNDLLRQRLDIDALADGGNLLPFWVTRPMPARPGDFIQVGEDSYEIVESEFLRFDTDEPWVVQIPIGTSEDIPRQFRMPSIVANWTDAPLSGPPDSITPNYLTQISGWPALVQTYGSSLVQQISVPLPSEDPRGIPPGGTQLIEFASYDISLRIEAQVGPETKISFSLPTGPFQTFRGGSGTGSGIVPPIEEFPTLADLPDREQRLRELAEAIELVRYVRIRPAEGG